MQRGEVQRAVPLKLAAHQQRRWRLRKRQFWVDVVFLLPALTTFTLFFVYPVLSSFYYSLTDWNGLDPNTHFIGGANFVKLLSDRAVWEAFRNTLVFALLVTVFQNLLGLLLALGLDGSLRFLHALRVLFLVPTLLSALAIGYIWNFLYDPNFGFINSLLSAIGLDSLAQDWLGNPHLALFSLIATHTWQWVGISMIIYLAGLQAVPTELHEAASIDGANTWQRFSRITFPLIAPSFTVNVVLTMIGTLKVFDIVFVMTKGGPGGATETLATMLYRTAFNLNNMGYGTAIAIVMFLFILVLSIVQLRMLRKRELEA